SGWAWAMPARARTSSSDTMRDMDWVSGHSSRGGIVTRIRRDRKSVLAGRASDEWHEHSSLARPANGSLACGAGSYTLNLIARGVRRPRTESKPWDLIRIMPAWESEPPHLRAHFPIAYRSRLAEVHRHAALPV